VLAEARGWSAATLGVAIPLAVISLHAALRGSLRGRLVWLGVLAYFVYTYLEFAVRRVERSAVCPRLGHRHDRGGDVLSLRPGARPGASPGLALAPPVLSGA
jgi:hypothetical protein